MSAASPACAHDDLAQDPSTGFWACKMKPMRRVVTYRYRGAHYEAAK
jgi:hypothetical protein